MVVGPIKMAIADFLLTLMWIFYAFMIAIFTSSIAGAIGVEGTPTLLIMTDLIATLVFIFDFFGALLGGATFNPTAAFYAAGVTKNSLFSMALRFPTQAVGAVRGTMAIMEAIPKVDFHIGAIAKVVLTFLITLAVLVIIVEVPSGTVLKT